MDKKRKTIIKIFKDLGFSINIQRNLTEVDFVEVTLNLQNGTYHPYKKHNDKLLYIQSSSNHLPQIIKSLKNSCYNIDLKYINNKSEKPKTLKPNIIWFNPLFSKSVSTNVAKTILQLVTKHFPRTHKLH